MGVNILMFIPAFLMKTDKFTDFSYSLTFIILTIYLLLNSNFNTENILLAAMIILWALRLGIFLVARIWKAKKDRRFDAFRESFTGFLKFWLLQGFAVWVIMIPTIFYYSNNYHKIHYLGFAVWLIGFLVESIADAQKFKFKSIKANENKFIKSGLWKYSRHPNYFGEILCWLGIYLFVFLSLNPIQMGVALISPLFIIILLAFVSGLPQLESHADKKWGQSNEYQDYKKKTSILIPWFSK